ncbi:MAG: hypothetical protein HY822_07735, partial [Acidobacteria bacterium]|nr:hypothetical protein [Acidobacteriota bacterium]
MRDPLLAPLAAIAGGILAAHFLEFDPRELLAALAALSLLTLLAWARCRRAVAFVALLAACLALGAWTAERRRPGPPPEIQAAAGEILSFTGCVA